MRIRTMLLGLLLIAWGAPAGSSCSILYEPYAEPTWAQAIWYDDGGAIHKISGATDSVEAEGYFVSYGVAGDYLLVAGQTGLGAGCEGENWLRLYQDGEIVWEKDGEAKIWQTGDLLRVHRAGAWYQLAGEDLEPLTVAAENPHQVVGWTHDGRPIIRTGESFKDTTAALTIPDFQYGLGAVAVGPERTGVLLIDEDQAHLQVFGTGAMNIHWALNEGYRADLAWADGWLIVANEDTYWYDNSNVWDLKLDGVSVTGKASKGLLFQEGKYAILDDGVVESSHQKIQGAWVPATLQSNPAVVPHTSTGNPAPVTSSGGPTGQAGDQDSPLSASVVLAAFGVALFLARRRMDGSA